MTAGGKPATAIDPDLLFFVVGTGRCGTTLLQAMLSSHPRIYIPPELHFFEKHEPRANFHDPLRDDEVDAYLRQCAESMWWHDYGLDPAAFAQAVRGGIRDDRGLFLWILSHVSAQRGNTKPRIGEKSTYYGLHAKRLAVLFPRAKFIHIYRDPRDVADSYMRQYWCLDRTGYRLGFFIRHYLQHMQQVAAEFGPDRCCVVQYETLVHEPERELRRICAFLGEDFDPAMLAFSQRADPGYHPAEIDWKGSTSKPLTDANIGRYAARLSPRQVWTIERRLGPLLRAYGYQPTTGVRPRVDWRCRYGIERVYRKVRRLLGFAPHFFDEAMMKERRNAIMAPPAEAAGGPAAVA